MRFPRRWRRAGPCVLNRVGVTGEAVYFFACGGGDIISDS